MDSRLRGNDTTPIFSVTKFCMPESLVDKLTAIAGANAVQVGTANFVDPFIWTKLLDGLHDYMQRHGILRLADIVGALDTSSPATAHA